MGRQDQAKRVSLSEALTAAAQLHGKEGAASRDELYDLADSAKALEGEREEALAKLRSVRDLIDQGISAGTLRDGETMKSVREFLGRKPT